MTEPIPDTLRDHFVPGTLIAGKYKVEGVLGEGGMGRVLIATQLDLGRPVAIKVLHEIDKEGLERFFREARALAALRSENVVRIYDMGQLPSDSTSEAASSASADGAPYLVMERLEGEDLATFARHAMPSVDALVGWAIDACGALAEAHDQGIVHRDIKPRNLFLAKTPSGTRLKVIDFGLVKFEKHPNPVTGDAPMGTPLYMSPEQILSTRDVDARTDVWSLGVTFYQLLVGRAPFQAAGVQNVFQSILTEEPPSLSTVAAPVIQIEPALAAVIHRCLEKEPAARFQNVRDLAAALKETRHKTKIPLVAAAPTPRDEKAPHVVVVVKPGKTAKKRSPASIFAIVVGVTVALGAVVVLVGLLTIGSRSSSPITTTTTTPPTVVAMTPSASSSTVDPPKDDLGEGEAAAAAPSPSSSQQHHTAPHHPPSHVTLFTVSAGAHAMQFSLASAHQQLAPLIEPKVRSCFAAAPNKQQWARVVLRVDGNGEGKVVLLKMHPPAADAAGDEATSNCIRRAFAGLRFTGDLHAKSDDAWAEIDIDLRQQ